MEGPAGFRSGGLIVHVFVTDDAGLPDVADDTVVVGGDTGFDILNDSLIVHARRITGRRDVVSGPRTCSPHVFRGDKNVLRPRGRDDACAVRRTALWADLGGVHRKIIPARRQLVRRQYAELDHVRNGYRRGRGRGQRV